MAPILPPFLSPGDKIAVMAPSSRAARTDLETSADFVRGLGYDVFLHPQCFIVPDAPEGRQTQYAGTIVQKVGAFHDLVRDDTVKALIFAAGGTRSLTLLDYIDFELVAARPKIYMGYSDNTALLNSISANTGLVTFHGPTFKRLPKNPEAGFNMSVLGGKERTIHLNGAIAQTPGTGKGTLIGGNLAIFSVLAERDIPLADNAILFLEDINEELTTIDRNLAALRRKGILSRLSGLIFGQFTNMTDTGTPFGMSFQEIILEHTQGLTAPIITNAPFGHADDLPVFPIGAEATLVSGDVCYLRF